MSFHIVIPARYASSRLPAKPLADIAGKPMIQRVYEQVSQCDALSVVVATDDARIESVVKDFGGTVCMTSSEHPSGTDRLQEVATKMGMKDDEVIVNVQGDEPLMPSSVINQVANNLIGNSEASVATLCEPITSAEDFLNPNIVKAVKDVNGMALYFSRASMPWPRDEFAERRDVLPVSPLFQRHIGIYAYRVSLLNRFVAWPPAQLEEVECLEQLRILFNGHRIHIEESVEVVPGGVDTPDDLERVRSLFA